MKTRVIPDLWGVLSICVVFMAAFYKSIFGEKAIAKLGLVYSVDAFFNSSLKQAIISLTCDPSGFLIFFPNGYFAQKAWHNLCPPLWNPFCGGGYPILGDPQSFIFSPLLALGLFSSPGAYNLELLLEIILAMFGVYALCRFLSRSIGSSVFAATAYGFCPHLLANTDLSGAECFIPWIFLACAWMSGKLTLLRAGIVAVCSLVLITAVHPESAFFAVAYAFLFGVILSVENGINRGKALKNLGLAMAAFAFSGLMLGGLVAPLVLPFLEFLNAGYLYKSAAEIVARVPPGDFLLELVAAKNTQPFYLGSILIALVPFALFVKQTAARATLVTALIISLFSLPGDWLLPLLSQRPFSFLATLYGLPELLILLCLSSAFALDWFLENRFSKNHIFFLFSVLVLFLATPFLIAGGFKQAPQLLGSNKTYFVLGTVGATAWLCFLWWSKGRKKLPVALVVLPAIVSNLAFEAVFTRSSLPAMPIYSLEKTATIKFLQESGSRIATIGGNFFLPNLQLNYGIQSIGSFNPMIPRRYHDFILRCGAECHNLYFYDFPQHCSRLLDLASIKYIVTRSAVINGVVEKEAGLKNRTFSLPRRVTAGVRFLGSNCVLDPKNAQIEGYFDLKVHDSASLRYAIQFSLLDKNGGILWSGSQNLLDTSGAKDHIRRYQIGIPVPKRIAGGSGCRFGFNVFDTWTGLVVPLDKNTALPLNDTFILGEIPADKSHIETAVTSDQDSQYELINEDNDGVRIYENRKSLPPAYAVTNIRRVPEEKILSLLDSDLFNPREEVLVSIDEKELQSLENGKKGDFIEGKLRRPDVNSVIVDIETPSPCLLVVTDLFYPGWTCTVNGEAQKIYCVNYLFRGVKLPSGKHKIILRYEPQSFQIGIAAALLTIVLFLTVFLVNRSRK